MAMILTVSTILVKKQTSVLLFHSINRYDITAAVH
jgi:hypothetical protein